MSHITNIKLNMKDVDGIDAAFKACGMEFRADQTSYKNYYGTKPCDGAARLPGSKWEVGLIRQEDGSFMPQLDVWGSEGQALTRAIGESGNRLKREYAAAVATAKAKKTLPGWEVVRQDLANGRINLRVRRR